MHSISQNLLGLQLFQKYLIHFFYSRIMSMISCFTPRSSNHCMCNENRVATVFVSQLEKLLKPLMKSHSLISKLRRLDQYRHKNLNWFSLQLLPLIGHFTFHHTTLQPTMCDVVKCIFTCIFHKRCFISRYNSKRP